ncbi:unnamed protein product, partial [Prorocentrum cordatum]
PAGRRRPRRGPGGGCRGAVAGRGAAAGQGPVRAGAGEGGASAAGDGLGVARGDSPGLAPGRGPGDRASRVPAPRGRGHRGRAGAAAGEHRQHRAPGDRQVALPQLAPPARLRRAEAGVAAAVHAQARPRAVAAGPEAPGRREGARLAPPPGRGGGPAAGRRGAAQRGAVAGRDGRPVRQALRVQRGGDAPAGREDRAAEAHARAGRSLQQVVERHRRQGRQDDGARERGARPHHVQARGMHSGPLGGDAARGGPPGRDRGGPPVEAGGAGRAVMSPAGGGPSARLRCCFLVPYFSSPAVAAACPFRFGGPSPHRCGTPRWRESDGSASVVAALGRQWGAPGPACGRGHAPAQRACCCGLSEAVFACR